MKKGKLTTKRGCFIFIFLLISLCFITFLLRKPTGVLIYRAHYTTVANAFWRAVQDKDVYTARKIVAPDQISRLDAWLEEYQKIECTYDNIPYGPQSSEFQIQDALWDISIKGFCEDSNGDYYCFSIQGMKVKKEGILWTIVDWDGIGAGNC